MARFLFNNYYKYFRVIKYLLAGGTATLVNLILLYFLTEFFHLWYLISSALAFIASFFVSFYLQKFWTFVDRDKEKILRQMVFYLAVASLNLFFNLVMMYFLVEAAGLWYMLAQLITGALIASESYLVYKFFIFNQSSKKDKRVYAQAPGVKILIATGIYPPEIGGPATMLEALANSLIERGFIVKVITYSAKIVNEPAKSAINHLGIYRVTRSKLKIFNLVKYFWRMLELASWADLIYVTDTYSVGYFAYIIKIIFKRKYIVRFAGDSAWETAVNLGWTNDYIVDFLHKKYGNKIEKLKKRRQKILVKADAVIVVSDFLAATARQIGVKRDKIKLIYNSVDFLKDKKGDEDLVKKIKELYGRNRKLIITACRLVPWKGVDGIIRILPRLKDSVGIVNFLVLGDGPDLVNLRKLAAEFKVGDLVHFLGRINNNQVMDYFRAADLFILNSNYEGLSHTLLEAMEAEVPIIASKAGGNPEVIDDGKNGLLVSYNNVEELFDAAKKILTDNQLAESFKANAKQKLEMFNWAKTIVLTEEVINEVIKAEAYVRQL